MCQQTFRFVKVFLIFITLRCETLLTDLPQCLPLIQHNIDENKESITSSTGSAAAAPLVWGNKDQVPEHTATTKPFYSSCAYNCANFLSYLKDVI